MLPTTLYLPFLSLASITLATPTRSLPSSLFKRDAPALDDVAWCNVEFEDAAAVETLWNDWGISALMDFSLAGLSPANEDWVTILVSRSVDNAADIGQFHCGSMYEECVDRLPTCETFVLKGMPQYYYILQAMKNLQDGFKKAAENLQDTVISNTLKIDVISDQFEVDIPATQSIPDWLTSALSFAGTAAGAVTSGTAAGTGLSILSTLSGYAATGDDGTASPDVGSMADALGKVFDAARTGLAATLALAAGGEGDYTTLPGQGDCYEPGTCMSPIAAFFSSGKFLYQGEGSDISAMFTGAVPLLKKKLVDIALSTAGYQLLVYTEDYDVFCAVYSGHYYIDTELGPRCVVFTAPSTDDTHGEAADQIGIMERDYDFDMTDYYQRSWDCFYAGYPAIDASNLPTDGSLPNYFYNGTITSGNDGALP